MGGGVAAESPTPLGSQLALHRLAGVGNHACVYLGQKTNRNAYELSLSSVSHLDGVLIILSFLEAVKLEKSSKKERILP